MRNLIAWVAVVLAVAASLFTAHQVLQEFARPAPQAANCWQDKVEHRRGDPKFADCVKASAANFKAVDFPEIKDLAKAFLTLVVAVFVASLTFSEKIVSVSTAGNWSKMLMILCWVALLGAIIACGAGIAFMTAALLVSTYSPDSAFRLIEGRAGFLFLAAGTLFGAGLLTMLVTGAISLITGPRSRN